MDKAELPPRELTPRELNPRELDRVFAGARATTERAAPSADMMERVMQDALAALPRAAMAAPGMAPERRPASARSGFARLWAALSAGFGGGGVVASLGAVAVISVFLGYSAPAGLADDLLSQSDPGADSGIEIEPVAIYSWPEADGE